MAKQQKKAIQGTRLRDQVYDLIREELRAGAIAPGQRLLEIELAARYGVSRTPVREALFQLAREGLLTSTDRGYALPVDRPKDLRDRLDVHLLLDPYIARQATIEATSDEIKQLSQALKRVVQAHQADKPHAFGHSFYDFRTALIAMCGNVPLTRCAMLIEDQYLAARNEMFKKAENRQLSIKYCEQILSAVENRDAAAAEMVTRTFFQGLIERRDELSQGIVPRESDALEPRRKAVTPARR